MRHRDTETQKQRKDNQGQGLGRGNRGHGRSVREGVGQAASIIEGGALVGRKQKGSSVGTCDLFRIQEERRTGAR